jgi:hypothetical protein
VEAGGIHDHSELQHIAGMAEMMQAEGLPDRVILPHDVDRPADCFLHGLGGEARLRSDPGRQGAHEAR